MPPSDQGRSPPRGELAALARKYRELSRLRLAPGPAPPAELAALSREFPGSLRELETLPAEELARRARSADAALAGSAIEPVLEWVAEYHALVRLVLTVKRKLAGRHELSGADAILLAREVSEQAATAVSPGLVERIASPRDGRLNDVVLTELATQLGTSPERLQHALFGEQERACSAT